MNGILFDWDGVVIDSSACHERSWELLAAEAGLPLPEDHFKKGFGKKNQEIIPNLLGWTSDPAEVQRLGDRKEELYRELVRENGVEILPGVETLLAALRHAGIRRAVASSTPRANLDALFESTGLDRWFDAVVCGDDVVHGKPAPDVFLKAAEKLGVEPRDAVVIEDALVGIEAAHAGGIKVLAVATTNSLDQLGSADAAVRSLEEVTPAFLLSLLKS
ncbi:MAG: HAD family phosphatase [Terrimicrobiaceae bacterium]|nr:HAD family phosphatase [Terrimicrobiaceae bacterium]